MSSDGVAVITGGARGIGWGIAEALARRGYRPVLLDNGTKLDGTGVDPTAVTEAANRLIEEGLPCSWALCDVTDGTAVTRAITQIRREHGDIHVLVNVAGILRPGPFLEDPPTTWDTVIATHVGGHLNTIRAVLPHMMAQGRGRIVNITSTAALLGSRRQPAYSAAKEAIVGLTGYLAARLANTGISVNAIAPSAATRMSSGLRRPEEQIAPHVTDKLIENNPSHVGRFVGSLVENDPNTLTGRLFLVAGNYVIEYEHVRPWKWAAVSPSSGYEGVEECLRWVLGRPHPTVVGPWPTRDFRLTTVERYWEGTSIGPDLTDTGAHDGSSNRPSDQILVFGGEASALSDALSAVGNVVRVDHLARDAAPSASGAIVCVGPLARSDGQVGRAPAPYDSPDSVHEDLVEPDAICSDLLRTLTVVRSAMSGIARHSSFGVVVLLDDQPSWQDADSRLRTCMNWYGAVGLVRGAAATESIYGIRCNAIACQSRQPGLLAPLIRYLLSPYSSWLNGQLISLNDDGIGLLADELPRWQIYAAERDLDTIHWFQDRLRSRSVGLGTLEPRTVI